MFFFFKQKTAYEMRISDWSSDVCSSDLFKHWILGGIVEERDRARHVGHVDRLEERQHAARPIFTEAGRIDLVEFDVILVDDGRDVEVARFRRIRITTVQLIHAAHVVDQHWPARSEEHTSELQSLMRISYAVFCLK